MTDEERKKRKAHVKAIHDEIRPLAETHPHLKDFTVFLEEFNEETERGAALAAAAFWTSYCFAASRHSCSMISRRLVCWKGLTPLSAVSQPVSRLLMRWA